MIMVLSEEISSGISQAVHMTCVMGREGTQEIP